MSDSPPLRDLRRMHEVADNFRDKLRKRSLGGGEDQSPNKKHKSETTPSSMVTRRRAHEQVRFFG